MKFKFKIQQYQTDAVKAIADVFEGQPYRAQSLYTMDKGVTRQNAQMSLFDSNMPLQEEDDIGFANARIELTPQQLLANIKNIQALSNLNESQTLSQKFGAVDLDVEMETGTGKTYVYIKSMF